MGWISKPDGTVLNKLNSGFWWLQVKLQILNNKLRHFMLPNPTFAHKANEQQWVEASKPDKTIFNKLKTILEWQGDIR